MLLKSEKRSKMLMFTLKIFSITLRKQNLMENEKLTKPSKTFSHFSINPSKKFSSSFHFLQLKSRTFRMSSHNDNGPNQMHLVKSYKFYTSYLVSSSLYFNIQNILFKTVTVFRKYLCEEVLFVLS